VLTVDATLEGAEGVVVDVASAGGHGVARKPEAHGVVVSVCMDAATDRTQTNTRSMVKALKRTQGTLCFI
jgi:hypothetical protein